MRELSHALRTLLRAPAYSAAIIVTLALGTGATTTLYSVVRGVLLEPLPFADTERLLMLWQRAPGVGIAEDWFSPAQYYDLRETVASFEEAALIFGRNITLTADDAEPERLGALTVSASFFDLLGLDPLHGRGFGGDADLPGAPLQLVLGHDLFVRRFGAAADIVGRTVTIDGADVRVVGVLRPETVFDADLMPTLVTVPEFEMVISMPMQDPQTTTHGSENFNIVARLRDDATLAQLDTELLELADWYRRDPGSLAAGLEAGSGYRIGYVPLLDQVVSTVRAPLLVLLGATAVLLVIACANAANLVLTRAAAQTRNLSVRAALGAARTRLIVHSLTQSMLLAAAAGVAGLAISVAAVAVLQSAAPVQLPRLRDVTIDPGVVAFALLLSTSSCLLFGIVPALRASGVSPAAVLRQAGAGAKAGAVWRRRGPRLLVGLQVALSLLLVAGAGLLIRTVSQLQAVDPGFEPSGVLTFRLSLSGPRYTDPDERLRFYGTLRRGIEGLATVQAAGGVSLLPMTRGYAWTDFSVQGHEIVDQRDRVVADVITATPGYFEALGVELLAGRAFTDADDRSNLAVIVNRTFADRFWGVERTVGRWVENDLQGRTEIIGIVDDVHQYGLAAEPRLAVFYPHAAFRSRTLFIVARTDQRPAALAAAVAVEVARLDADLPVYDLQPMASRVRGSLARERLLMVLLNLFGGIALILATVGLYAVLSYAVAAQIRELGIRKSLGARRGDLVRLVLAGAGRVAGAGIGAGLVATLMLASLLDGLMHGVSSHDPLSLTLAAVVVAVVAGLSAALPARRAAAVDPITALRLD